VLEFPPEPQRPRGQPGQRGQRPVRARWVRRLLLERLRPAQEPQQARAPLQRQVRMLLRRQVHPAVQLRAHQQEEPGARGAGRGRQPHQVAAARQHRRVDPRNPHREPQAVQAKERNHRDTAKRDEAPEASLARHHRAPKSKNSEPSHSRWDELRVSLLDLRLHMQSRSHHQ